MDKSQIRTLDDLKHFLVNALQLEHATIPPYLTALYSIKADTNQEAREILRVVALEEMLHMTLVANMLNAIGGKPDLTGDDFVPDYPAYLPDGETKFKVDLQGFSEKAVDTFLEIEQPTPASQPVDLSKADRSDNMLLQLNRDTPLTVETIGEFYAEISRGFELLYEDMGVSLFSGDPAFQITSEHYYAAGSSVILIKNIESVRKALHTIAEQGEGYGGTIYDEENELAHYYRFEQLKKGRCYVKGNDAGNPTGSKFKVDYSAVYPIKTNPKFCDYPEGSELHAAAVEFAEFYKRFLGVLTEAYTGQPNELQKAVAMMFAIKEKVLAIIRNPIPGSDGVNATPIFALPRK